MGPNPNGPRSVSCETELLDTQVVSGSVQWVLLEISWKVTINFKANIYHAYTIYTIDIMP